MAAMDRTTGNQRLGAAPLALRWMCEQHSPQGGRHGNWRSDVRGRRRSCGGNWAHQSAGVLGPGAHRFESSSGALRRCVASAATRDRSHPHSARQQRTAFPSLWNATWACIGKRDVSAGCGEHAEETTSLSCQGVIPSSRAAARKSDGFGYESLICRDLRVERLDSHNRRARETGQVAASAPNASFWLRSSSSVLRSSSMVPMGRFFGLVMTQAPSTGTIRSASGSGSPTAPKMSGRSS